MTLVEAAFSGASVSVSTELGGPVTLDLEGATGGPPNPLLAWLKPSVVFRRNGSELYRFEPYGPPVPIDWEFWVVVSLGALLVFLLWRRG